MKNFQLEYNELIDKNKWSFEKSQKILVDKLDFLSMELEKYSKKKYISFTNNFLKNQHSPQGLYIFGNVGIGKSVLMDIFFNSVNITLKRRVHFHEFMLEVHERIRVQRNISRKGDPIKFIAKEIVKETKLLCFDEFQVNDTADAMILQRLFRKMFERNLVVVATSNRHPDNLYLNGLNRELFIPFISLLKKKCTTFELNCSRDYRLEKIQSMEVYFTPITIESESNMEKAFSKITGTKLFEMKAIEVKGRKIIIERFANGVGMTNFTNLCAKPLASADYIAIAEVFHTLFIQRIPKMRPENKNEARRFINLIDILYEHNVNLVCNAEVSPNKLYEQGDGNLDFTRTASRLHEMQSKVYLSKKHKSSQIKNEFTKP